jgi:hypothetical protein
VAPGPLLAADPAAGGGMTVAFMGRNFTTDGV